MSNTPTPETEFVAMINKAQAEKRRLKAEYENDTNELHRLFNAFIQSMLAENPAAPCVKISLYDYKARRPEIGTPKSYSNTSPEQQFELLVTYVCDTLRTREDITVEVPTRPRVVSSQQPISDEQYFEIAFDPLAIELPEDIM